jgi:tetratricopeptide (TPR) repeat protein
MSAFRASLLTAFIWCITTSLSDGQEPHAAGESLHDVYDAGNYIAVIREASDAMASGDTAFQNFYLKALSEIQLGRTDSAVSTLRMAIRSYPEQRIMRRLFAGQLFEAGAYPEAAAYYASFARADSGDVEAWLKLARIASTSQQYDSAVSLLHHLLSLDPVNFSSLVMLGEVLTRLNDTTAIGYYEKAYRLYPENQQVAYALGNWYIQAERPYQAVPLCERVLENDSANIRFLKLLGFASYKMNDYPGAAGRFQKAIELGDSTLFSFKFAGIANYLNMSLPAAIHFLSLAAGKDSTDAEVHFFLGASLAGTTRKEEAMFHLEKSLELIRPDPAVVARIYSEQGNIMRLEMEYENAYELYRRAWHADTTNPMALYYMASILDNSLHRSREAMSDYRLFLEKLDRMPPEASENDSQLPTIREIVEDRIESLREELFFLDQRE